MGDKSDNRLEKLSPTAIAIAGASSGLITRAIIQPFDVLKIRFQLQVEPISKSAESKYTGMLQATSLIFREEGITAFWKGHVPAQILSITFGLIQFWSYETLVKSAKRNGLYENKVVANFVCGAIAGTAATFASFPFDIMRTRLIAQSEDNKVYKGIVSGYAHMIKNEGLVGMYKGITPTVVSVAPNAGLQFMFYEMFHKMYRNWMQSTENSFTLMGSLISGSMAGICSKTLLYPLDLTRKRMQIQGFQKYRRKFGALFLCYGMGDCLIKIYKHEGPMGLFKGGVPSIIKALFASSLNFTTFEMMCQFLS